MSKEHNILECNLEYPRIQDHVFVKLIVWMVFTQMSSPYHSEKLHLLPRLVAFSGRSRLITGQLTRDESRHRVTPVRPRYNVISMHGDET